ncbi:MAG: DUF805 domain-containing protein [Candidatus Paceibacterota bacterium]|jgi:uncharacterized membrane protein YhaH (DUF805 family)
MVNQILNLFKGRIGRLYFLAGNASLNITLLAGEKLLGEAAYLILFILALPLAFSLVIKRLHDINRSGWYSASLVFLFFLEIMSFPTKFIVSIISLLLLFWPGTPGENKYG